MTQQEKELQAAAELTRERLKLIDPKEILDMEKESLSEVEIMARATDAELFYMKYFEKVLKLMIYQYLQEMGVRAETPGQVLFYRGILYGLQEIVQRWFEQQVAQARSRFKDEGEELEPDQSVPQVPGGTEESFR